MVADAIAAEYELDVDALNELARLEAEGKAESLLGSVRIDTVTGSKRIAVVTYRTVQCQLLVDRVDIDGRVFSISAVGTADPSLENGDADILERGRMEVYRKSRQYEAVGLTEAAHDALARLKRVQDPPTDDWPVFPTEHAASKYAAVEEATGERPEPGSDIDAILRDQVIAPLSITKEAGRQIMQRLTEEAGIELEGDAEYLQPHGARRALGVELYEQGHSELAQSALRHKSIETTHEAYTDIQAEDVAESIDKVRE